MRGSRLAAKAVHAAELCELAQVWLREGADAPIGVVEGWEDFDAERRQRSKQIYSGDYLES